jgi:IS30 family transposase
MAHHHVTDAERLEIGILLRRGYSLRDIASALGRSHTSISREIRRNSVRGKYDPRQARAKARIRRRYSKYQGMKVQGCPALRRFVVAKLQAGWTPEEIAGRLKLERGEVPCVSSKGIYKWLASVHGQEHQVWLVRKGRRPRRRGGTAKRSLIPYRVGIEHRPAEANDRSAFGHYEADTVLSGKRYGSTAALSVLLERKARYVRLRKLADLKPKRHARALRRMAKDLVRKTLTFDNGIENREHRAVAASLAVETYFCRPYRSWEKGGVENAIGRIRRYVPKGADLAAYSDAEIARIEHWLNHTPRKCLNFKTPHEIMCENLLFTSPIPGGAFEG